MRARRQKFKIDPLTNEIYTEDMYAPIVPDVIEEELVEEEEESENENEDDAALGEEEAVVDEEVQYLHSCCLYSLKPFSILLLGVTHCLPWYLEPNISLNLLKLFYQTLINFLQLNLLTDCSIKGGLTLFWELLLCFLASLKISSVNNSVI